MEVRSGGLVVFMSEEDNVISESGTRDRLTEHEIINANCIAFHFKLL
jgi:hypothetical protein